MLSRESGPSARQRTPRILGQPDGGLDGALIVVVVILFADDLAQGGQILAHGDVELVEAVPRSLAASPKG